MGKLLNKTVLLVGGTGKLATSLVSQLESEGAKVLLTTRKISKANSDDISGSIFFIKWKIKS